MPKQQIPFLSSVLRSDIQNYCTFELQSPDNMTIVNKLLYIDSCYLASMVIFSNVLKRWFLNIFLTKSCFKTTFHHGSLICKKTMTTEQQLIKTNTFYTFQIFLSHFPIPKSKFWRIMGRNGHWA